MSIIKVDYGEIAKVQEDYYAIYASRELARTVIHNGEVLHYQDNFFEIEDDNVKIVYDSSYNFKITVKKPCTEQRIYSSTSVTEYQHNANDLITINSTMYQSILTFK